MQPIIDAHLDLAWNALSFDRDITQPVSVSNAREEGMTDCRARTRATVGLPDMRRGRVAVCLGTMLARSRPSALPNSGPLRISPDHGSVEIAHATARGQLAYYRLIEQTEHIRLITTARQLEDHWETWLQTPDETPIGLILAMEGADPIVQPQQARGWFELGLRALNLVHYGHNQYAAGTGVSGPITPAGLALLKEMERLGIVLDVTHLSEPSFFQALDQFGGAIQASHNNCRALVPGDRQFSDQQILRLVERQAVIGVALDNWMLHPTWQTGSTPRNDISLSTVANHIDHICQLAGSHAHVAIGSDLDGGYGTEQSPREIETIADLQQLFPILERRGYGDVAIEAIAHRNWLNFFLQQLP